MANQTAIEWTDLSWNPVHGCSKVSRECDNCYAEELSYGRYGLTPLPWLPENAKANVTLKHKKVREPLSGAKAWQGLGDAAAAAGKTEGKLVFVNSMSDLFHPLVPREFVWKVFETMEQASQHTFQVLTKRPKRMREWCRRFRPEPLPNVWLGTSIGEREWVGRADLLRDTPAAVRFISAEPLLEPLVGDGDYDEGSAEFRGWSDDYEGDELDLTNIDWLIVGGESGKDHRPMRVEWVQDLRDACLCPRALGTADKHGPQPGDTAFFFKQWGGARPGGEALLDGREWREFPAHPQREAVAA